MKVSTGTTVDYHSKFIRTLIQEFMRRIGSRLLVGSAYTIINVMITERVYGVLGDTIRGTFNNGPEPGPWRLGYTVALLCLRHEYLGIDVRRPLKLNPFCIDQGHSGI